MLRAITEGRFEFRSPEWDEIGVNAKDLITKLLVVDPLQRYTTKQALAHPFFICGPPIEEALTAKFSARKRFRVRKND